jgi:hypothetical protein
MADVINNYYNDYPKIKKIAEQPVVNNTKYQYYTRELESIISKLIDDKYCKNKKLDDKSLCRSNPKFIDFVNVQRLCNDISNQLYNLSPNRYNNLSTDKLFTPNSIGRLDIYQILFNVGNDQDLYKYVLLIIHNHIIKKTYPEYSKLIGQLYRLGSPTYVISIKEIKLENYEEYANKLKNELKPDYKNMINIYVIKNKQEIPIYKKLFDLLNNCGSMEVTSNLATKIEKDLIILKFEKKIKIMKNKKTNFTDEQKDFIKSIIDTDIDNNIELFTKDKLDKIINYIKSDDTSIDNILKIKRVLTDAKTGGNMTKKVCSIILYIIIILLLLIIILICLYGLYIICDKTYCMCTNSNSNEKKLVDNNVNIT